MNTRTPSLECVASRLPGLIVGLQSPDGYYNLTNGILEVNYSEIIGLGTGSYGLFNQKNGTHTISGNLYLGRNQGGYGSFSLRRCLTRTIRMPPSPPEVGLLDVHGYASVAYEGDGDFLQKGGTVKIRGIDREIVNQNLRGRLALSRPTRSRV